MTWVQLAETQNQHFSHQQLTSTTRCRRRNHTLSPFFLVQNRSWGSHCTIQKLAFCYPFVKESETPWQKGEDKLAFINECTLPNVPSITPTSQPLSIKRSSLKKWSKEMVTSHARFAGSTQHLWGGSDDCTSNGHIEVIHDGTTANGRDTGNIRKHCKKTCAAVTATSTW